MFLPCMADVQDLANNKVHLKECVCRMSTFEIPHSLCKKVCGPSVY